MTPELAHWFGIRPWEIDDLTYGELDEFTRRLRSLPPVGGTALVEMKG